MSNASWKEQFGGRVTGYDPIQAQGLSELGYALKHNQISQEEYLNWARQTYEVCSLDVKFFQSQSAVRDLYERLKDVYAWGPECMPIAEWDEHVIVAGLEKPADLPTELKPIFLLAPLEGLEQYWNTYQNEAEVKAPLDETKEEAGGVPEGLSLQEAETATNLNFAGIGLAIPSEKEKSGGKPDAAAKQQAPETQAVLQISDSTSPAIKIVPVTPIPSSPGVPKTPPPKVGIPTAIAEEAKAAPAILSVENEVPPQVKMTQPIEIEKKAQPQVVAVATSNAPLNESLILEALEQVKEHYDKRLYIEFSVKDKTAVARIWPQDFVAAEQPSILKLEQDSFLSIVYKTQKPYHGYVTKSDIANQFFKELNNGEYPENLTLVPLIKNGDVTGALVGWGLKTSYTLSTLRALEKIADDLSQKLGWITVEDAA